MLYVLFAVLGFWVVCNLIVLIKWKPAEMLTYFINEQNKIGRIFGGAFYTPYLLIHFILICVKYYIIKPIIKFIKFIFFAVARFIQQIYHSIFDIL